MDSLENDLLKVNIKNPEESFSSIADNMMKNYIIKKGDNEYAFIEIEFYLYSPSHQDFITYPRQIEAGRWFFHQSGVDLTFSTIGEPKEKNNHNGQKYLDYSDCVFGGILIRGLYKLNHFNNKEERYIFGPQNCVNELWDDFNAFNKNISEYPIISKSPIENNGKIVKLKRHIKIDINKQNKKVTDWAERIGYASDLQDNQDRIQKYKEELFTENNDKYLYRFLNIIEGEKTWNAIKHLTLAEKNKLK